MGDEIKEDFVIAVTELNMNIKLLLETCLYSKFNLLAITRLPWNRCVTFLHLIYDEPVRAKKQTAHRVRDEIQSREFPRLNTKNVSFIPAVY